MPHKDILITIWNRQQDAKGETQSVKVTTEGRLYQREADTVLMYKEAEQSGMDDTTTTVSIPHDLSEVVLTRIGDNRMKMQFKEGNHYMTHMATPFGYIDLGFYTQHMELDIGEHRGEIKINYALDFNHKSPISNHINIKYQNLNRDVAKA